MSAQPGRGHPGPGRRGPPPSSGRSTAPALPVPFHRRWCETRVGRLSTTCPQLYSRALVDAAPFPELREEARVKTITKKELVNRIADGTSVTKVVAKEIIQSFLNAIIDELAAGNRLEFREFGVFESRERAARRAQNPRTLEKVDVPAKRIVKFKVGRLMRKKVAGEDVGNLTLDDADDVPATSRKAKPAQSAGEAGMV